MDDAIESFTHALRLDPDFAESHQSLGETFAALGKIDEATKHFQAALRILKERSSRSPAKN
jgi:tetratricopeptide (TPR) repeat protein